MRRQGISSCASRMSWGRFRAASPSTSRFRSTASPAMRFFENVSRSRPAMKAWMRSIDSRMSSRYCNGVRWAFTGMRPPGGLAPVAGASAPPGSRGRPPCQGVPPGGPSGGPPSGDFGLSVGGYTYGKSRKKGKGRRKRTKKSRKKRSGKK